MGQAERRGRRGGRRPEIELGRDPSRGQPARLIARSSRLMPDAKGDSIQANEREIEAHVCTIHRK